ncbi:MAG: 2-dehydro-3-deoxyphosphooctonate aldolase [Firmicutes bacterium]|nr:2-dehydro-3-deoxyphosphooctonate aldolase [Bacillota bacterium]
MTTAVKIGNVTVGGASPLVLIAGPCVIEGKERTLKIGREIQTIAERLGMPYVFKASFDKANRSSFHAFRGPGLTEGLKILAGIKQTLGVPVLSDIHEVSQVQSATAVLDVLQIPAFLCRQTDLLHAAAQSGLPVNVKKGQFLSPAEMKNVVTKLEESGSKSILLTERGSSFGYNNLVVDMRSLAILRSFGYPVIFDATHSVQLPGGGGDHSAGQREFVPVLARAAAAVGIDALFLEVHDNPSEALSDGPNMVPLSELESLLTQVLAVNLAVRGDC